MQTFTQQASALPPLGVLADTATPHELSIAEWLTFKLGSEEYGIDILSVQEIRSYEKVTRIVNAPPMVKGVINLRGVIVPIVDMRIRFNLETVSYDDFTVVIVLNIGQQVVGMVIDGVSDVVTLAPDQMKPAPALSNGIGVDHLLAIGSVDQRTLLLLDIQKLMRSDEMGLLSPTLQ
ncbi:MAG: chemotaxis protein CheW [Methylotenera sp.]|nr:chemotaxis protein CheW [Methylotenera sp.]